MRHHALLGRSAATVTLIVAVLLTLGPGAGATFTDRARASVGISIGTVDVQVSKAEVTGDIRYSQGSCESCPLPAASTSVARDGGAVTLTLSGQASSVSVDYTVILQNTGTLPATAAVKVTGPDTDSTIAQHLTAIRADGSTATLAALETGQIWFVSDILSPGDQRTFTVEICSFELDQSAPWTVAPVFTISTTEVPTRNHPPTTG